jgi:2-desacetyl-2-hydroxyethyl bacteriochlorophyllide A dehydrogenase
MGAVLGHEYSGEVVAAGRRVVSVAIGDRVAVIPLSSCGTCPSCAAGSTNVCETKHARGANGAFAQAVLVPDADLRAVRLPDGVDFDAGALIEPLATAVHAVRATAPDPSRPVAVFGLGPIGLLVIKVLREQGMSRVLAVDRHRVRREAALRAGASDVFDGSAAQAEPWVLEAVGERVGPFSGGSNVGTIFDCTGATDVLDACLRLVAPGGTIALLGLYRAAPKIDALRVVTKDVTVRGCFAYTRTDFLEATRLVGSGAVNVLELVSHTFGLESIDNAFSAQQDKEQALKVLVYPHRSQK